MLAAADLTAIAVTLKLAFVTTLILLVVATPLAWWLARSQWRFKFIIEAAIALPLVLPPTVLGFYLLLLLSPSSAFGQLITEMGLAPLAFSFTGLIIGSVIYSLPFMVQPLHNAFAAIGNKPLEVAATLGASPVKAFIRVALPLAKPGFVSGAVLSFAHTLGEFGVVLMIGGNIPGETRLASIAVYEHVETLNYQGAHQLSLALLGLSFLLLTLAYISGKRSRIANL
ncbi:MAG: molybdate ABC transporter permease subunit [Gammaproteobacteria bacterium]|nr:molybdate ABC transporter permease subunit [Gammaproteobacteria bacterium]